MQTRLIAILAATLLCSTVAQADWALDGTDSTLHYVTSKAGAISEVNTFGGLSGAIDAEGAQLVIDLSSVNTAIEIRDQRMRDIVFQAATYPVATVSVAVNTDTVDAMAAGSMATGPYTVTLDLHGASQELQAELQVIKLDADTLLVHLAKPLLVGAVSFGLAEGVEQLREIAGLPSINPNIVVDFALVYRRR
jgi:polyisoprenoid-binding protein YceI